MAETEKHFGIWNSSAKQFQFGIDEPSKAKAQKTLFAKIGKDAYKGNELKVGDNVVFIKGKNSLAELATGAVTKIYKNTYGEEECSVYVPAVGTQAHVMSSRVIILEA